MTRAIKAGVYDDLPEDKYHGDKRSLSSTGVKRLLVSPLQFQYEREHPTVKDPLEFGNVVHALGLGKGSAYRVLDYDDRRTNAYKADAENARAAGVIPILKKDYERAEAIRKRLHEHPVASPLLLGGRSEVSAFALDPATKVMRRARADKLHDNGLLVDLKTTAASALPERFAVGKTSESYGYDVSAAYYEDTFALAGVAIKGFVHIFVEKDPPHLISVVELDRDDVDAARPSIAHALEVFRDCTKSGVWPDWTNHHQPITPVRLPGWKHKEIAS